MTELNFEERVRLEVLKRKYGGMPRSLSDLDKTEAELEVEVRAELAAEARGELLAAAELRGRARTLAQAPTPRAAAVPAATPAATASEEHRTRRRADPLAAVIKLAEQQALDATDWESVWAALVALAQPATRPAPLLGYVEGEGVKYQKDNADGRVGFLSRDAFRKRFDRKR